MTGTHRATTALQSPACQKKDWSKHKELCNDSDHWYDKYRGCRDGSMHEGRRSIPPSDISSVLTLVYHLGKLVLITWEWIDHELGEHMGWGNVPIDEVEAHKRMFEVDCHGRESRFFKKWPQGFCWTCCGASGSMNFGCDHHGSGSRPCTCDFCW